MPSVTSFFYFFVISFCCAAVALTIYFFTKKDDSSDSSTDSGSPAAPAAFKLTASTTAPAYSLSGYHPIPLANLPTSFTLKNTATGNPWSIANGEVRDIGAASSLSADAPADLYSTTGTGTYRLKSTEYIRHRNYLMYSETYAPNNVDFAWQLFLKDGTNDQVIVWNPYPGDGKGYWVVDGSPTAGRQQIANTPSPTIFTLAPSTTSGTSTYIPEPYSK